MINDVSYDTIVTKRNKYDSDNSNRSRSIRKRFLCDIFFVTAIAKKELIKWKQMVCLF